MQMNKTQENIAFNTKLSSDFTSSSLSTQKSKNFPCFQTRETKAIPYKNYFTMQFLYQTKNFGRLLNFDLNLSIVDF